MDDPGLAAPLLPMAVEANAPVPQVKRRTILHRLLAEFFGTFMLIFCGTVVIINGEAYPIVGVAFGLAIYGIITTFGPVSGAHVNPAVTLALTIDQKIRVAAAIPYICCQCLGSYGAAITIKYLYEPAEILNLGATVCHVAVWRCLTQEAVMTCILVLVVMGTAVSPIGSRDHAPAAIAGTVTMLIAMGSPYTGASLNPARSLGPAVAAGFWRNLWVFIAGPLGGAIVGRFLFRIIHPDLKRYLHG